MKIENLPTAGHLTHIPREIPGPGTHIQKPDGRGNTSVDLDKFIPTEELPSSQIAALPTLPDGKQSSIKPNNNQHISQTVEPAAISAHYDIIMLKALLPSFLGSPLSNNFLHNGLVNRYNNLYSDKEREASAPCFRADYFSTSMSTSILKNHFKKLINHFITHIQNKIAQLDDSSALNFLQGGYRLEMMQNETSSIDTVNRSVVIQKQPDDHYLIHIVDEDGGSQKHMIKNRPKNSAIIDAILSKFEHPNAAEDYEIIETVTTYVGNPLQGEGRFHKYILDSIDATIDEPDTKSALILLLRELSGFCLTIQNAVVDAVTAENPQIAKDSTLGKRIENTFSFFPPHLAAQYHCAGGMRQGLQKVLRIFHGDNLFKEGNSLENLMIFFKKINLCYTNKYS